MFSIVFAVFLAHKTSSNMALFVCCPYFLCHLKLNIRPFVSLSPLSASNVNQLGIVLFSSQIHDFGLSLIGPVTCLSEVAFFSLVLWVFRTSVTLLFKISFLYLSVCGVTSFYPCCGQFSPRFSGFGSGLFIKHKNLS